MSSPNRKPFLAGALLVGILAASCSGSGAGVQPPASSQSTTSAASSNGPMQLAIRRIGPYKSGQATQSLRVQQTDPLLNVGLALSIKPDNRYVQLCSKFQLSVVDRQGAALSPIKWFLDKSEVIKNTSATLDRDKGELITKFVVEQLYIVAYYHGIGAWGVLHMINSNQILHSCEGDVQPAPTPSANPLSGQPGTDPDYGAF